MAIKQARYSDLSGDEIPDGTGARIRVMFNDPRKADRKADLTDEETETHLAFTIKITERGPRRRTLPQEPNGATQNTDDPGAQINRYTPGN